MIAAICLVALTGYTTGEPVVVNATNIAYLEAVGEGGGTSVQYSHLMYVLVREDSGQIRDIVRHECKVPGAKRKR